MSKPSDGVKVMKRRKFHIINVSLPFAYIIYSRGVVVQMKVLSDKYLLFDTYIYIYIRRRETGRGAAGVLFQAKT